MERYAKYTQSLASVLSSSPQEDDRLDPTGANTVDCVYPTHTNCRHKLVRLHRLPLIALLFFFSMLLLALLLAPVYSAYAESEPPPAKTKVLFLPFTINVPGSYAYLESGLSSVLSSRLASRAGIQPIGEQGSGEQLLNLLNQGQLSAFRTMLNKTKADFLVLGSLDRQENIFVLTSYVFGKSSAAGPVSFEEQLATIDQAMDAVDNMSWSISEKIFNRPRPKKGTALSDAGDGVAAFQTIHPERAYREGLMRNAALGFGVNGQFELVTSHRSRRIEQSIQDFNGADIDGDGRTELVLLTNTQLLLYRFAQNTFTHLGTIPLSSHLRLHSVTFADMNSDGRQEIYVSGNSGSRPSSMVVFWDGDTAKIHRNIPYYLRAVALPGEPPVLYGQAGNVNLPTDGPIYELRPDSEGTFTRIKEIVLPSGVQVYDFIMADITGDGARETILITPGNRLQVLNDAGSVMWTSSSQFGAGRNFFGTLTSNEEQAIKVPTYIKSRIIAADMDRDGILDVIVGRNQAEHVRFMPRLRYFEGGSIMALSWKTNMLTPLWETEQRPEYMINYQVIAADLTDGQQQQDFFLLFGAAQTSFPFAFWQADAATINSYRLRLAAKNEQTPTIKNQ